MPVDAHTLDTLMQRATLGDQVSFELRQVSRAGAWLV